MQNKKHCHHHQSKFKYHRWCSLIWSHVVPYRGINISEKSATSRFRIEDMSLPWRCREQDLLKHWNAATKLQEVTSKKTVTLTFTNVRISDLSNFKIYTFRYVYSTPTAHYSTQHSISGHTNQELASKLKECSFQTSHYQSSRMHIQRTSRFILWRSLVEFQTKYHLLSKVSRGFS
jgi:hypothetical protein